MITRLRLPMLASIAALALVTALGADAPRAVAITNARIVTAAGPIIERGTIVLRDGLIEAVGASVTPPPDARVIDGKGRTVYPGLIDMGTTMPVEVPSAVPAGEPTT
ncbi:MAG: hypothetical protein Q7V01_01210, partial [Vicinamibacterales bacterium]|nr:hypothetical protein [Vicinamibacterales bacterium]